MPAQISGFEYDVFISYRQNDNRSAWVTDFVKALETELAATIKLPVSIYFDSNPTDGLLETHNVDKSVEAKLKCAIFLPILSQTYCDANGFAWQHEFLPFNRESTADKFGRDVKLANGNVASRILPIRIHDLDPEDKAAIEREMATSLRPIDFIYREPGVNRPLTPDDNPEVNLNKTRYRNQVNKVANSIKELLSAMHHFGEAPGVPAPRMAVVPIRPNRNRVFYAAAAIVVAVALGYLVLASMRSTTSNGEELEKSIAVLPFANLSNDPEQEYFSDGMTDQIITNLSHLRDVKVIARTSVLKYKGTTSPISEIGVDLKVNYVLEGSVQRAGSKLRVNAQLIRTNDNFHEWAEIFNRDATDIFEVQDYISKSIATALGNTLKSEDLSANRPSNTAAYDMYLRARHIAFTQYYWNRRDNIGEAFTNARALYEKAIQLDSNFALAYAGLADLYDELRNHNVAAFPAELDSLRTSLARKAFRLDPNSGFVNNVKAYVLFSNTTKRNLDSTHYYLKRAYVLDPGDSYFSWCLGVFFQDIGLHDVALPYQFKARDENPNDPKVYSVLGLSLLNLGRQDEAAVAFGKALSLGGNSAIYNQHQVLNWLLRSKQIDRAIELLKANNIAEAPYWVSLVAAAQGDKEKALADDRAGPLHYLLLGMHKDALAKVIGNAGSETWNPYLSFKHSQIWEPVRGTAEYVNALEKARIADEKLRKRFGIQ